MTDPKGLALHHIRPRMLALDLSGSAKKHLSKTQANSAPAEALLPIAKRLLLGRDLKELEARQQASSIHPNKKITHMAKHLFHPPRRRAATGRH